MRNSSIGDLTFIVGESGRPLTKESFGNLFPDACREAGVPGSAHGVQDCRHPSGARTMIAPFLSGSELVHCFNSRTATRLGLNGDRTEGRLCLLHWGRLPGAVEDRGVVFLRPIHAKHWEERRAAHQRYEAVIQARRNSGWRLEPHLRLKVSVLLVSLTHRVQRRLKFFGRVGLGLQIGIILFDSFNDIARLLGLNEMPMFSFPRALPRTLCGRGCP